MEDVMKMALFLFLGLVVAILVLGFHKSPKASPQLGQQLASTKAQRDAVVQPLRTKEQYPSDKRKY